ncbi:hypothetical protein [Psychrobium sp. 1_MG-2023]|uniref:hypothetical protein n=1 Tax=Psychrobium sp. 1_MG-2023 TaxID=3062624 RepID=UPI000C31B95C|nr:hypothetical protein [Psychrobium sp. 1_MG-2023]MDP2562584.1 hypothetical protein [Psychrobium sp. 1_MG-2023]PKF59649.1 hypothetical protein CW748_00105 [Alteromonadales bacterium alter-6D02]
MKAQDLNYSIYIALTLLFLTGCTSVTVDQIKHHATNLKEGESIVVIGRRSGSNYETEPELVSCIGTKLSQGETGLNVIDEKTFVDRLYPWFEARTAPTQVQGLQRLLSYDQISQVFDEFNVHYIVWVDGNTEKTRASGSISCGISAGGAACFGFGSWDNEAEYEASIWDYQSQKLIGKVSSIADGTSYMPAVVVPIPLIAQVQTKACQGMAQQLKQFLQSK